MNLVAYSWGRANLKRGDRVLLTEMEHHSNIVPWQILAAELGFEIAYVRVADDGTLILDDLPKLLAARPSCSASPTCRTSSARSTR